MLGNGTQGGAASPVFFALLELLHEGSIVPFFRVAGVAELADALDSKFRNHRFYLVTSR